jgi:hypothetical protein
MCLMGDERRRRFSFKALATVLGPAIVTLLALVTDNGEIALSSEPGTGSTFTAELPTA